MGNANSGRRFHPGCKLTTDDLKSIDVRCWHKQKLLQTSNTFNWSWFKGDVIEASLTVEVKEDYLKLNDPTMNKLSSENTQFICLDWTNCHLGGKRPWFICPNPRCSKRAALLYGLKHFACRECYQLVYASQRESDELRLARKAEHIRKKLGWTPGIFNPVGFKPKGMHWQTFSKLNRAYNRYTGLSLSLMAEQLPSSYRHN